MRLEHISDLTHETDNVLTPDDVLNVFKAIKKKNKQHKIMDTNELKEKEIKDNIERVMQECYAMCGIW